MDNQSRKLKVAVLFGGVSGEHEISLLSARSILSALDPERYEVIPIGITHEGEWLYGEKALEELSEGTLSTCIPATLLPDPTRSGIYLLREEASAWLLQRLCQVDIVFPVLHGTFGEDGTIQGLLEIANVAYVGSGVVGSAVGMDKGIFKDVMRAHGIPVVDWKVFTRREVESGLEEVVAKSEAIAPYPLFVKPANLGSSVGVSKCRNRDELISGLKEAIRYDRRILVERGVNAREIEVSVLGNEEVEASIPGEIIPADEFYSYHAKYHDDRSQLLIPAPLEPHLSEHARSLAVRTFKAIDAAGMARVDMLLDKDDGELYVNEINTIPGFTRISMYPKLWNAVGISYPQLV
ncbi:MAG: D-alanine--D-alanine ligase family protein, partial [Anaerolineales bacterium]|nr:D-alanine--D-alanine ligase [Anaerolineales bacterium]MDW8446209.1 D-alanine--D-alanine ligase family protein [Anaerolineales bacterium]